ncbi:MAG: exo-alpha-sialidase [Bryobacterales bacterium]|nr:exo-alpha-sialidase [Bryobacterales bacterium]
MKNILLLVCIGGLAMAADFPNQALTKGLGYFPVAISLKNGDVLAVIRGGAPHIGVKGRLDLIRSTDGGKTWSAPWTAVDGEFDDRNPAMGQLKDGTVVLAYAIASGYDETGLRFKGGRNDRRFDGVYLVFSKDNGKTWSKPVRDPAIYGFYANKGHISPYGKIIQLPAGDVLMAVYFEFFDERGNQSYIFRSKDGGRTWGEPVLLGEHFNETGILRMNDGRLLAAMRSQKGGHIAITESSDQAKTWSKPNQVTADSEHPADLIQLRDGRVLMVFGQRNAPRGVHAMVSPDGRTWEKGKHIVLSDGAPNGDCGYPSSVEVSKGKVVTLYYQVDDLKNALATSSSRAVVWSVPNAK